LNTVEKMPWGGAPKCPGCEKTVYPMDQIMAADRKAFHTRCIRCQMFGCGNDLTARSLHKYDGYNICNRCYENVLGSRTYGPAEGEETIDQRRKREEEERKAREKAEKSRLERRCMECDKKTFPDDSAELAPDMFYHKICMKCSMCPRTPDDQTPLVMAPRSDDVFGPKLMDPYCKFCYAKKFKVSMMHVQEIVTIAPEHVISL